MINVQSENGERVFEPFAFDHWMVVGTLFALLIVLIVSRAWITLRADRWFRSSLALSLFALEILSLVEARLDGRLIAPLQLCDVAVFVTIWALLAVPGRVAILAYFWAIAGSVQAILTPDLMDPFPQYGWFRFFVVHCVLVISAAYLAVMGYARPTLRSLGEVWIATNLYALVVGVVNWRFGTNYGYLAQKPAHPSALDYFGDWPNYLIGMEIFASLMLIFCYLPFVIARRRQAARL